MLDEMEKKPSSECLLMLGMEYASTAVFRGINLPNLMNELKNWVDNHGTLRSHTVTWVHGEWWVTAVVQ